MTIVAMPGLVWPRPMWASGIDPVYFTQAVMNNNPEMVGFIVSVPKAGAIRRIGFKPGTVTTDGGFEIRIETVSANVPSGTLWGTDTNIVVVAGSLVSDTMVFATLTADATVALGDYIAIVVKVAAVSNWNIGYGVNGYAVLHPVCLTNPTGAGWTAQANNFPVVCIEYSDGTYADTPGTFPITGGTVHTFASNSAVDERALKFQVPVICQAGGFHVIIDADNAFDVVLYDTDGSSVLASVSVSAKGRQSTVGLGGYVGRFTAKATLQPNVSYYLSIKPTTTSSISTYSVTAASVASMDQFPGGQVCHAATRVDAGAWTAITTQRPLLEVLLDGIDVAAAGGGGPLVGGRLVR